MGILNATPDPFSDGGRHASLPEALAAAARFVEAGVDIIDIGGESTRPGAPAVSSDEEAHRVLPLIAAIKDRFEVRVSVDTMKAAVAREALAAGADMVNDVSGLGDPEMLPLLLESEAPVVIMHMRGTPETMQRDTRYEDLLDDVVGFLRDRVESAVTAGVAGDKIVVDPGIGFGKSAQGSLHLLSRLSSLGSVGQPILVGVSRKSFLGAVSGRPVEDRLEESLAVAAFACAHGAHIIRAHDAEATVRVVRMVDAVCDA